MAHTTQILYMYKSELHKKELMSNIIFRHLFRRIPSTTLPRKRYELCVKYTFGLFHLMTVTFSELHKLPKR
jgi:hypothetical protein